MLAAYDTMVHGDKVWKDSFEQGQEVMMVELLKVIAYAFKAARGNTEPQEEMTTGSFDANAGKRDLPHLGANGGLE